MQEMNMMKRKEKKEKKVDGGSLCRVVKSRNSLEPKSTPGTGGTGTRRTGIGARRMEQGKGKEKKEKKVRKKRKQ